jgi:hypothetical protein
MNYMYKRIERAAWYCEAFGSDWAKWGDLWVDLKEHFQVWDDQVNIVVAERVWSLLLKESGG